MTALGMIPTPIRSRGYTLMIHLFLDDSGKESQPQMPWVCMAGYLADIDAAVSLNQRWRQLLIKHGIRELHMKQLIPITGPYAALGWDVPKRDSVVNDFIHAINETQMYAVGVAVEMAAWRQHKKDNPSINLGTVQQFCLERILSRVVSQLHTVGIDDALALVFDTDPEFGVNRFNLFCALMGHDRRAASRLTSITFAHPEYYPGLQAADLLAWETRKELMQKQDGQQSTRRWQAMVDRMPDYHLQYAVGERWDAAGLSEACAQLMKGRRDPSPTEGADS